MHEQITYEFEGRKYLYECTPFGYVKGTTPCPLHNSPLSLIYSNSSLLITYCIGKVYIFGNPYNGMPHLHTLVRRSLSYGVESRLGTWCGGLKMCDKVEIGVKSSNCVFVMDWMLRILFLGIIVIEKTI